MAQRLRLCLPVQEPQETRVQSLGREDPLEKEMATCSSLHAWRIPWTEEPGVAENHTQLSTHTVINTSILPSCPTEKVFMKTKFSCIFSPFYQRVTHTNKPPEEVQTFQKFPGAANESVMVPSFPGNPKAHLGVSQLRRAGRQSHQSAPPSCHHSLHGHADLPRVLSQHLASHVPA